MSVIIKILGFLFIFFIIFQFTGSNDSNEKFIKELGVNTLEYIQGIDGVYDILMTQVSLTSEQMLYIYFDKHKYNDRHVEIKFSDIKNMSIKTEEQVKKEVTVPRAIILGVFALGLKKEKRYNEKYLIINYDDNGQDKNIVLRGKETPKIIECYDELLNDEKNKNINVKSEG